MQSSYRRWTKRGIDLLVLIGLAPLLLVLLVGVGGLVRWRMGTPAFFKQIRIGYRDRPFTLLEFRTMVDLRDSDGKLLHEDRRLTSFGMFLRRSSLDELPTLWNVVRGNMTLVGPRPLWVEYLPLYGPVDMYGLARHPFEADRAGRMTSMNNVDRDIQRKLRALRHAEQIGDISKT